MNKLTRLTLVLVMLTALVLIAGCVYNYFSLGRQLRETEIMLAESRDTWNRIDAEKLELLAQLQQKQDELKEARLSLSEDSARADEIEQEIDSLHTDIENLNSRIGLSD